jgi:hypothetical protein
MGASKEKTLGTWWLINQGQTLIIINGGHGLMGGTLWELSKLMISARNLIRNRSFGEYFFQIFNDHQ